MSSKKKKSKAAKVQLTEETVAKVKADVKAIFEAKLPPEVQAASTLEDLKEASAEQAALGMADAEAEGTRPEDDMGFHEEAPAPAVLEVGKTYTGTDGKTYEVVSVNEAGVVAKCGKKKIPFPRAMFEVLVGIMSAADYDKAQDEKRVERKEKAAKSPSTPKEPRKSGMSVIRNTLANNLKATLEEISAACREAGVPKSDSTIKTIMSDFKQTYQALLDAGQIILD